MSNTTAQIIDGKKTAFLFLEKFQEKLFEFKVNFKTTPFLAIIRVGNNPSSALYVKNKLQTFSDYGLKAHEYWLEETVSEQELYSIIDRLNKDAIIHGIIVQLPLPSHLNTQAICNHIDPLKDVDGLTVQNQGLLMQGDLSGLFPCTPLGCLFLLKALYKDLSGKRTLIIGRSALVGRSMALLLLHENATITIAHSKSHNLPFLIQDSEIIISAIGKPHFIKGKWAPKGSCILDVGINKIISSNATPFFVGDVEFEQALKKVSYITPVPGGVGPMTIACLLYNTYKAAQRLLNKHPTFYDFSILEDIQFFN